MKRNQTVANFNTNHNKTIASSKSMRTLTIQDESKNKKKTPITPSHGKPSQIHYNKGNKYQKGKKKKKNYTSQIALHWKYISDFMYKEEIKIAMKLNSTISKSIITYMKEKTEKKIKESDSKLLDLKKVYLLI